MCRRVALVMILSSAAACHTRTYHSSDGEVADATAEIVMRSASGANLGTLHMERQANGSARLVGSLTGVPTGTHGIHIHAVGRCEGPTFESAGGHFNPHHKHHGLQNPAGPHAGDAPNVDADSERRARIDVAFPQATLNSAVESGVFDADGAAVVLHADDDDQKTDPSGNSGARIICGVVNKLR